MIREALLADASALCQINRDEMGYNVSVEFTKEQLALLLKDQNHHLIAVFEDDMNHQVLGYVHAELYRELYAADVLNVWGLAVATDQQGKGIGKSLMQWLEEEALSRNIHAIRLNSGANRLGAHRFYQKLGFEEVKLQKSLLKSYKFLCQ
ncbi:GNAT family N-acetyltransferase [Fructobacillus papyrifericola]|uniref:GNAT family N-acetyltransferase n=1 Tax=Fructobacillus papyrifericola TaxID=2713172 RepID=A0ABS5QS18_9LACO|nr:GNAT family N-acetyltransferase [Fructobacillus papyrifericola]MBS9335993.1 GNAT family N-acetyltransferase [Fructobacillus papyrifericola]